MDFVDVEYYLPETWTRQNTVDWLDRIWTYNAVDNYGKTYTKINDSGLLLLGKITLRTYFMQ